MSQWSERLAPEAARWAAWRRTQPEALSKEEQALLEVVQTHTSDCLRASGEDVRWEPQWCICGQAGARWATLQKEEAEHASDERTAI